MGIAKHIDDDGCVDAWERAPWFYEAEAHGDYTANRVLSWISPRVGDDELHELRCVSETPDHVTYRGRYPTMRAAQDAILALVDRAGAKHVVMHA